MIDPITLSVPGFFVAIGIEAWVARRRHIKAYRFADSITDLSCGISSQVEAIFSVAIQLAAYSWLYTHARLLTLTNWQAWILAFFGVDFFYYWWHRASHEINFFWAAHVVHHQSEDYNLAVALRQSVTTGWTALPFYLPLAFLGVPTIVFATVHALSTLYQFWIHTELVPKIKGPLDYVLNLPHHHRVHHAVNVQYLDKNYGATLIVWDRIFGTYIEEDEKCVYGISHPLSSFNVLWAQFHYFIELFEKSRALRGVDKIRVWFVSPAWTPEGRALDLAYSSSRARPKFDIQIGLGMKRYVGFQFVVLLLATAALLAVKDMVPALGLVVASAAVLGGVVAFGGLMEGKHWAKPLEVSRLAVSVLAIVLLFRG